LSQKSPFVLAAFAALAMLAALAKLAIPRAREWGLAPNQSAGSVPVPFSAAGDASTVVHPPADRGLARKRKYA
jgi:hypothetical protein